MTSEVPRQLRTALAQSAVARTGMSGSRVRASALAQVAEGLREHGLPAALLPSGRVQFTVSTSRFTAHSLPGTGGAFELRVQREGRNSILGLVKDPDEAVHLLVRCAAMATAWELAADVYDRLVMSGETSVLSEVPMGETLFVRLGERTYAELTASVADPCLGESATISLITHICPHPIARLWRFDAVDLQDFPTMGRIAGGRHATADAAVAALELHRARTSEWERLH